MKYMILIVTLLLVACANVQPQVDNLINNVTSVKRATEQDIHDAMKKKIQQDYDFVRDWNQMIIQNNMNAPTVPATPAAVGTIK